MKSDAIQAVRRMPDWVLAVAVAAVASLVSFYRLGEPAVYWWDEARVALNSLEMMHSANPLVVTYNGQADLWNTEPPLAIWLNALSMRVFGVNELALRLPAALASVATILAVFEFTRRIADRSTALLASLILLGIGGYIEIHVTRTAEFDSLLVLFSTLTTFSLYFAFDSGKFYPSAVFAVCGFLTKGIAGLMMAPGYLLYAILFRKDVRPAILPGLAVLGAASLYLIARESTEPGYLHGVWLQHILRFGEAADGNGGSAGSYAFTLMWPWQLLFRYEWTQPPYFATGAFPWGCVALLALIRPSRPAVFLFCCAAPFILLISIAATHLNWYLAPAYPLIAVLGALAVLQLSQVLRARGLVFLFSVFALFSAGLNLWKIDKEVKTLARSSGQRQVEMLRHVDSSSVIGVRPLAVWRTPAVRNGRIIGTERYFGPLEFYRRLSNADIRFVCDEPSLISRGGRAFGTSCHGPDFAVSYQGFRQPR